MNYTQSREKIQLDQQNIDIYKRKIRYFGTKGFLYACILSIIFRKPKTIFPIALGIATGFCHNDLKNIFFPSKEDDYKE